MTLGQWSACGVTAAVIAAGLTAYAGYRDVLAVQTEEVDTDAWGNRPDQVEGIHNILLMATDERSGDEAGYSAANGIRPDVIVLASVDVDRSGVTMVNLPRDLMVQIPPCDPAGEAPGTPGTFDQLNHAMVHGGMDCQAKTVEDVTDVRLDHMVLVDFAGFQHIVDSVGGIEMCIPEPMVDPKAHLDLPAGQQVLDGEQALALARSRDTTELGSDLERIRRQQEMLGLILGEVTGGELLSSPTAVYDFLGSVNDSLVADSGFTMDAMAELVIAMREVDLDRVNMVTVPVVDADPALYEGKVELVQDRAQELFAAVAAGEVLPEEESGKDEEGEEAVEPSDVSLRLLNNNGTTGLAAQVEPLLTAEGFDVVGTGNPEVRAPELTTVYHGPGQEASARLVAGALVGGAQVEEAADLGESLELVMGADWQGIGSSDGSDGGGGTLEELGATTAADTSGENTC
ncbi:LCP family protein [Nocardiopsis algeriensis]|uniref:LCP family protein n=1 Tax=Nocardiopsis algeriensis TaxID=1478215 RepID=UPI003B42DDFA